MLVRPINGHWMTVVLPMTMLAYLFFTTHTLLTYIVPVDSKEMLYNILSQMLTMTIGAVGYWTGTTRGSTERTFYLVISNARTDKAIST